MASKVPNIHPLPKHHWESRYNQRKFFDYAREELKLKDLDDWYAVKNTDVVKLGGKSVLEHYGNSLYKALCAVYPEREWVSWKFHKIPRGYWDDIHNQRKYFDWLTQQLNITKPDQWYDVEYRSIVNMPGAHSIIKHVYKDSLINALKAIYPNQNWQLWRFQKAPQGFWKDPKNCREFLEWMKSELGFLTPEDWYHLTQAQLVAYGGSGLLKNFSGFVNALSSIYPEYKWLPWKFTKIRASVFETDVKVQDVIQDLSKQLQIVELSDWYRISMDQLRDTGTLPFIQKQGGLYEMLKRVYPNYSWDLSQFSLRRGKKSSQRLLKVMLSMLFNHQEIYEDYQHPDLKFSNSNELMQLDVFLPQLKMAFEYQGRVCVLPIKTHSKHHYQDVHFFGGRQQYQFRDLEKIERCKQAGITLIAIPFWWDNKRSSLLATIAESKPDLIPLVTMADAQSILAKGKPIPSSPPSKHISTFWKDEKNQLEFMEELREVLNIQHLDDFYKLTNVDIIKHGGGRLLNLHNSSLMRLLKAVYPNHEWIPYKFVQTPSNIVQKDTALQRRFFEDLASKLKFKSFDDWYLLGSEDLLKEDGGNIILRTHNHSVSKAITTLFPEHSWLPWKFRKVPTGFWYDPKNQLAYMNWLGDHLKLEMLDDWYSVTTDQIFKNGGRALLSLHNNSLQNVLKAVYPKHEWKPWKFLAVPDGYWQNFQNVAKCIEDLSQQLQIKTLDDWYRVSGEVLENLGAGSLLKHHGGLGNILTTLYPHHNWNLLMFSHPTKKASQRWMKVVLSKMFPEEEIHEDFHGNLSFESARSVQIDVFFPNLKLGFEYQGLQHFQDVGFFSPVQHYAQRDAAKKNECRQMGIALVDVPFWWDRQAGSLAASIAEARPDLIPLMEKSTDFRHAKAIPKEAPPKFRNPGKRKLLKDKGKAS